MIKYSILIVFLAIAALYSGSFAVSGTIEQQQRLRAVARFLGQYLNVTLYLQPTWGEPCIVGGYVYQTRQYKAQLCITR